MRLSLTLLSIISALLLVSCGGPTDSMTSTDQKGMKSHISLSSSESDTSLSGYKLALEKAPRVITDTREFDDCMGPSVNMCVSQVGTQLARTQKSEKICETLLDTQNQDACKFGVIMMKASEEKNPDICNTLSDVSKDQCRSSIIISQATEKRDIQICDKLSKASPSSVSGEKNTPLNTDNFAMDQCKMSVLQAKNSTKIEDCKILSGKNMQEMCEGMMKPKTLPPGVPPPTGEKPQK